MKTKELREGVYEHVLTKALARGLDEAEAHTDSVKAEQLASLVSRHVAGEVRRMFALAPGSSHMDLALELADRLFGAVADVAAKHNVEGADFAQEAFEPPARRLLAVGAEAVKRRVWWPRKGRPNWPRDRAPRDGDDRRDRRHASEAAKLATHAARAAPFGFARFAGGGFRKVSPSISMMCA